MQSLLAKILTLVALALMPFGMVAAPAAAQPAQQHHGAAAAAAHCPEPASDERSTADQAADCTMTCAAVVAPEPTAGPVPAVSPPPPVRPLAQRGSGLHSEAATPPPKRA
ncbi:MAG: hypothetical protein ABIP91_08580 [Sphingomicrobium sp.]